MVLTPTEEMSAVYNPVDVELMRLETRRRQEELAPLAHRGRRPARAHRAHRPLAHLLVVLLHPTRARHAAP